MDIENTYRVYTSINKKMLSFDNFQYVEEKDTYKADVAYHTYKQVYSQEIRCALTTIIEGMLDKNYMFIEYPLMED